MLLPGVHIFHTQEKTSYQPENKNPIVWVEEGNNLLFRRAKIMYKSETNWCLSKKAMQARCTVSPCHSHPRELVIDKDLIA